MPLLEIGVNLARRVARIHVQHRHAVVEDRLVQAAQLRQIEWKALTVVQAQQETCDKAALAGVAQRDVIEALQCLEASFLDGFVGGSCQSPSSVRRRPRSGAHKTAPHADDSIAGPLRNAFPSR